MRNKSMEKRLDLALVFVCVPLVAIGVSMSSLVACSDFEPTVEDVEIQPDQGFGGTADEGPNTVPDEGNGQQAEDTSSPDYGQPHVGFPDAGNGGEDANTAQDEGGSTPDQGRVADDGHTAREDDAESGPDTWVEPIDDPECPGYVGCSCEQPEDCFSGLCVPTPDGHRCTRACSTGDDCQPDELCRVVDNGMATDATYACLNRWPTACRPCIGDSDCAVPWLDEEEQPSCIRGNNNDSFCAPMAVGSTLECPEGYEVERLNLERGWSWVCLPLAGSCPCNAAWQRPGFEMTCQVSNEFGTCEATRLCHQECPAAIPGPETCDGADNDCDGTVDDDLTGLACEVVNDFGACPGTTRCANGHETCIGNAASREICDGADNDCDGLTDEDLGTLSCGIGRCRHQVNYCRDGMLQFCNPQEGATAESCNGIDDDCDGLVDEDMGKVTCGLGLCTRTVDKCIGGKLQICVPLGAQSFEKCDLKDNDCDGLTDEGYGVETCGIGPCRHSVDTCAGGIPAECDPFEGATMEICNGLDEDCDGHADNALSYPALLMEPNNDIGSAINLGDVFEGNPTRSFQAMIYPYGDADYYIFEAVEGDHSCPLGWDQDYKITVTLFNPVGPGDCHGQTVTLYSSAGVELESDMGANCLTHTLEYKWDGECGPDDSRKFFLRIGAMYENGVSCMPYEIRLTMTKI